jgi:hypothetical protein
MSNLYDRVASKPGGEQALAAARLRREVLVVLHQAFAASGLHTKSEIARRLNIRRSAVSQVFRGDGNLRITTLAEYLSALGFELQIGLVEAGEPRRAELEARAAAPAIATAPALPGRPWAAEQHGELQPTPASAFAILFSGWFAPPQNYQAVPNSTYPHIIMGELVGDQADAP